MQLHSTFQGYFLLRHLESVVGLDKFLIALKDYVHHFHGQLVSSEVSQLQIEPQNKKCVFWQINW